MLDLPRYVAATVQASPVFLDAAATVDKACRLIGEAARGGARLVAFPEVFVPGYPYWNWIGTPVQGSPWFEKLYRSAVDVPGDLVSRLAQAAAAHRIHVVIGVNERSLHSFGTIYNTILTFSDRGELIGHHRKLVPTWAEKLTWTGGDGSSLKVMDTEIGGLGVLACGENTNTLARFALLAQGERVHVASYISLPVAPPDYDMAEAIRIRGAAHSFEGKVFTLISCSTVSEEIITAMEAVNPEARALLERKSSAYSAILGPDGRPVSEELIDVEGITYAEIDLARCIQPKQMHDIIGHYNRFDIFDLKVNRVRQAPLRLVDDPPVTDRGTSADEPARTDDASTARPGNGTQPAPARIP